MRQAIFDRDTRVGRALLATGALGLLAVAGSCTVGSGTGIVNGSIYFLGCSTNGADYGEPDALRPFDLQPHFFAGEPIEDIANVAVSQPTNILTLRIQRNGNAIEVNDTLYFNIQNSFEVARCLRGRTVNGVPDYSTRTTTSTFTEQLTNTPWCDWSGTGSIADGGANDGGDAGDAGIGSTSAQPHARIHLGTEEIVHASLSLLFTCHRATVVGDSFDGWIDFEDFGSATDPAQLALPSDQRAPIAKDFKVNFGDRLRARFEVVLGDEAVVSAIKAIMPIPSPLIGGTVGGDGNGFFDFDLERGRAAQPFP